MLVVVTHIIGGQVDLLLSGEVTYNGSFVVLFSNFFKNVGKLQTQALHNGSPAKSLAAAAQHCCRRSMPLSTLLSFSK